MKYIEKGEFPDTNRRFSVMRCNHCADSPCTDICPVTALYEREDGIVDFDPERCIGCKSCMQGCPYDSIYIDPETETAAKCNYCSHRVDSGREPACVTVCPEDAIVAGDLEDPSAGISKLIAGEEVQARKPEKGTEPSLFYVDGDDASTTPGATAREEHYMWSDAPASVETRGVATEDFDLEEAARSLAESDVAFDAGDGQARAADDSQARADGGCGCGDCGCGNGSDSRTGSDNQVASDGGHASADAASDRKSSNSSTARAYELLQEEARRVYDVGEDHYGSWGREVYSYTWTKAVSAGIVLLPALFMLAGLVEPDSTLYGASAFVGGLFLAATGGLLVSKLTQPQRFHWVLLRPNWSSWLVRGAYIVSLYGAYLAVVVLGSLAGVEAVVHPVSLAVGVVLSTGTAIYTAFLLGQAKGRDLWQSPAMPLHMFAQALVAGSATSALLGVAGVAGFDALVGLAGPTLGVSLVGHAALVGSEVFTPHQTEDAEEAVERVVHGTFRTAFWGGAVVVGMVLPLAVLALGTPTAAAVAGGLALAGLFAFEYCWITAPQTISLA